MPYHDEAQRGIAVILKAIGHSYKEIEAATTLRERTIRDVYKVAKDRG